MTPLIIHNKPAADYKMATCLIIRAIIDGQPDDKLIDWQAQRNCTWPQDHKAQIAGTPSFYIEPARSLQ